jgi:Beta xylosidase C-terminal Concanavalin A-like domain
VRHSRRWDEVAAAFRQSLTAGGPTTGSLSFCLSVMENALDGIGKRAEFIAFCEESKKLLAQAEVRISLSQWHLEATEPARVFDRVLLDDDFVQPQLQREWQWHDPIGASSYSLSDRPGYLTLSASERSDLWPEQNLSAPRLLLEMGGDFALETRMEGDWDERSGEDERGGEISGLLVWKDWLNFLRLEKRSMTARQKADVILEGRVNGEFCHIGRGRVRGPVYYLRLERTAERFAALCSTDGKNWWTCGQAVFPARDPLLVGVHAIDGMTAHFDYVRVLGKADVARS